MLWEIEVEMGKTSSPSKKSNPIKVLVAHDNKSGYHTTKSHKFAERLDEDPRYRTIFDKKVWTPKENTSRTEINKREKEMVKKADVITRIVPPTSLTGQERRDGALSEIRKAIHAGKPIIEIFERGARDSPNRPLSEKNYENRVPIHLQPGEHLDQGFQKGLEKLKKKQVLDRY